MLRRRRRQRLDRDVAAAAAAAAAQHQPRFEDDDEPNHMVQYGGYYQSQSSHDIEGQEPEGMGGRHYDYEDPTGGYDTYAANLVDAPPHGQDGGDRSSTFTQAGMAGFGAQAATNGYSNGQYTGAYPDQQQHMPEYGAPAPDFSHSYGDPQYDVAHVYASPDMGLSTVPEMSAEGHSDTAHYYGQQAAAAFGMAPAPHPSQQPGFSYADDPYGGYENDHQPPQQHNPLSRLDSNGSVQASVRRDLTVSNV